MLAARDIIIVTDTRERRPYHLPGAIAKALPTGDYSVASFEDRISVERKSTDDLLSCIGGQRQRFERELERLKNIPYAALVIEANLNELLNNNRSDIHPSAILGSLVAWSWRFHLPIWFAGDRVTTQMLVERLLNKGAQYIIKSKGGEN